MFYSNDAHERSCIWCGDPLAGENNYCSTECKRGASYEKNKNRLYNPRTDGSRNDYRDYSVDAVTLPNRVSSIVDTLPNTPRIVEDTQELDRIIAGELPKAKYADGKVYKPEVPRETLRRVSVLNSIAYEKGKHTAVFHRERVKELIFNGKRKESMVIDEEESTSDTPTKN